MMKSEQNQPDLAPNECCSYCEASVEVLTLEELPCCSKLICIECSYDISLNLNENIDTKCKLCQTKFESSHRFTKRIIQKFDDQTFMAEHVDSLRTMLKCLEAKNDEFIASRTNHRLLISEYCDRIRYDIFTCTESAIKHLNKINDELIGNVNKYEEDLLKDLDDNDDDDDENGFRTKMPEWESIGMRLNEFTKKWTDYVVTNELSELSQIQIQKVKEECAEKSAKLDSAQRELKKALFGNKFMQHRENNSFFECKSHIGHLDVTDSSHQIKCDYFKI